MISLVTQNVDDLHERARSTEVIHLHGELSTPYCEACRQPHFQTAGFSDFPQGGERIDPPGCRSCGPRIRPGVVWFGERLPEDAWAAARQATEQCEVFLCCGTSARVQPAASLVDGPATLSVATGPIPTPPKWAPPPG
jgi:NAD-dependent deacetylase